MTTWRMTIEVHEQERLWLAWPTSDYTLADTEADARPLFARGGGIHCITQQQPKTAR